MGSKSPLELICTRVVCASNVSFLIYFFTNLSCENRFNNISYFDSDENKININVVDGKISTIYKNSNEKIDINCSNIDSSNLIIQNEFLSFQNYFNNDYILNLNSRIISSPNKELKLTEKEVDIIMFLNESKIPQSINVLQNKVWGYLFKLETHTVETHIYRLRKKIKDQFNDDNFITSHDAGYLI